MTDAALEVHLRSFLGCTDAQTMTMRQLRETMEQELKVPLESRKAFIRERARGLSKSSWRQR